VASGKSEVQRRFAALGVAVVDADVAALDAQYRRLAAA
jgi:dephospho-CoA kinase